MYIIERNNVITLTRGDYLQFPVKLETGRFPYKKPWEMEEGDFVYFGLMHHNEPFERAFLKKEITYSDYKKHDGVIVTLYPEDTIMLEPGIYYYEMKALYNTEGDDEPHVDTLIQKTKFILVD